ncbi:hypothetical protein [Halobacillus andaensis]
MHFNMSLSGLEDLIVTRVENPVVSSGFMYRVESKGRSIRFVEKKQ